MITPDAITKFESHETPFYAYDLSRLEADLRRAKQAADQYGFHLHYALKANTDDQVLKTIVAHGLGADCVSGAEVSKALEVGFKPSQIAFAGVGKSDREILLALASEIFTLNVESIEELRVIETLAGQLNKTASIALRLNPDVDAHTHHYITTGLEENKFGISGWQIEEVITFLREAKHIKLTGLHFHIGSQIVSLEPFKNLCARVNALNQRFLDAGFQLTHINAGGGLGIDYQKPDDPNNPDFEGFFAIFHQNLRLETGQELHFELGRSLVANCGDLISRVLYIKRGLKTNFMILDAGMTELIRPALYQAVHKIENLSNPSVESLERYDVVGPVCESSDCFGKALMLPPAKRGDLIALRASGAYGEAMASHYNLRKLGESLYYRS